MVIGISWFLAKDFLFFERRPQSIQIKPPPLTAKKISQESTPAEQPATSETHNDDIPIFQNIHEIAENVEGYKQLPEPDRTWVLDNTINSLKAGILPQEKIQLYITQLSSLRMHTVLERQESYVDSTEDFNDFSNEENL